MNTHSEQLNELFSALSKAQSMILTAAKDKQNPFYKSRYSDLSSVWDAIREPLSQNGLTILQPFGGPKDSMILETWIGHSSGQWMKSTIPITPLKSDPQSLGSYITYLRRYALSSLVGVVSEEDDDGEAATKHSRKQEQNQKPVPPPIKLETDEQLNEAFTPFTKDYHEEDPELIKKYLRIYAKHWKKTAKETIADYQDSAKFCVDFMQWKKKNVKE